MYVYLQCLVIFFQLRNHILYLIENYQTVVIVGETGCGKSTQIPQVSTFKCVFVLRFDWRDFVT